MINHLKCQHCGKVAAPEVQESVGVILANMKVAGIEVQVTRYHCKPCKDGIEKIRLSTGTN